VRIKAKNGSEPLMTCRNVLLISHLYTRHITADPYAQWKVRIVEEAKLLAKPDVSITEIGTRLGFRETSAFSADFTS